MRKAIERKTIFLYPGVQDTNRDEFLNIQSLITKLTQIVSLSNDNILDILSCGVFSKIKCMPTVIMKCIDAVKEYSTYNGVRICIVKFDSDDYRSYYSDILNEYKNNKSDISHIVAIYLTTKKDGKAHFYKDKSGDFDIIIETNLEHLQSVLTAIMIDISLYHYFSSSNELEFRKDFNKFKCSYILNNQEEKDIRSTYGNEKNNLIGHNEHVYLPFSMKFAYTDANRTNPDSKKDALIELVKDYSEFLISSFSRSIILDKNGRIKNIYSYQDIENFDKIQEIIEDNSVTYNNYLLITSFDSTNQLHYFIVEYRKDMDVWANNIDENIFKKYDLYRITKKE